MSHFIQVLNRLKIRNINPNGFLDVGAHFGESNEIIRAIYPGKRIISFEANPNCEIELKMRGMEHLICLLGRETKESAKLYMNPDNPTSTGVSIYKEKSNFFENATTLEIPMYRLDDIVPVEANLDFMKIDVQGAEIDVLEGASKLIPTIKWIFLEVSFVNLNEGAPLFDDVYMYLRNLGYRITDECEPTYVNDRLVQTNYLFERL
jgi:FkbM family methyltransferase